MNVIRMKHITRQFVRDNPKKLFLYGDNLEGKGLGGQAKEMRGEPNAKGIPTKKKPTMEPDAFFSDDDFDMIKQFYDDLFDINTAGFRAGKFESIVIPLDGIGTGLAELPIRAPKIYEYLQSKLNALELM